MDARQDLELLGYSVVAGALEAGELAGLRAEADRLLAAARERGGARGAERSEAFRSLVQDVRVRRPVEEVLGPDARAVKLTLFDKTPGSNWKVRLHRDHTLSVAERIETPGFGPWSLKDGVHHVQPPREVLADLLAVRIQLDDATEANGALEVVPGSHLDEEPGDGPGRVAVPVDAGGLLLMRPLLLHASRPAEVPDHRRVLHVEYAARGLPGGLRWATEIPPPDAPLVLFRTERLRVRRLGPGDVEALLEVYGDPEVVRYVDDGQPLTREEAERWVEVTRGNVERRGYGMTRVGLADTDELVGFCGLVHPGGQEEPEIKYALRPRFHGRGLATELVRAMLAHGRERHGMDGIIATVHADNGASLAVLAKAGMRERGRERHADGSVTVTLAGRA